MPIIFLDSNIYRQMGIHFKANIDYMNLETILDTSGNEFGLLEVVHAELMDYYRHDIFNSLFDDHENIYKRYESNPYLNKIQVPETTTSLYKAIELVDKDLKLKKYVWGLEEIDSSILLRFLLHNKRL